MGKGLLVDLDGTLADSVPVLRDAYFSFLSEFDAKGSIAEFERLNGRPLTDVVEYIKETHNLPAGTSNLMARYNQLLNEAHCLTPTATDALKTLDHVQARGWRIAVVTSSPRRLAMDWIRKRGLEFRINAVVAGDDVRSGKPSPEPYNVAITRLGCSPSQSLAVEDSRPGAQSAVAAGLCTLVIADRADRSDWPPKVKFIDRFADIVVHV